MYRNSMKELQVDYIDYLLLHGIGMDGMEALHNRYLDNGILDFLLKEKGGRTHPQPRLFLPRGHRMLRLAAGKARHL